MRKLGIRIAAGVVLCLACTLQGARPGGRAAADPMPATLELQLPWSLNDPGWYFAAGPHATRADPTWSAVDWAPISGSCPATGTPGGEVLAARGGTIAAITCSSVEVAHEEGWSTRYTGLPSATVQVGQTVARGETLGYVGCGEPVACDAVFSVERPHLHFEILRHGVPQPIDGAILSGWRVNAGSSEFDGTMSRGGKTASLGERIPSDNSTDPDDGRALLANGSLGGVIDPAGDHDFYYYDGQANEDITIDMTRGAGDVDPYLILTGPDGAHLQSDDDGGGEQNASLIYHLPATGRYTITAKSYSPTQTGSYTVTMTPGTSGRDADDGRWLTSGQPLGGTISPANDEDVYFFQGIQDRAVSIHLDRSGDTLDSLLELYGPHGQLLARNDDGGADNLNAWLVSYLPADGVYRVKARAYDHASSGPYVLQMRILNSGANYASQRPAAASASDSSANIAAKAVDRELGTQWSSGLDGLQWLSLDLGDVRTFDNVILRWGKGYARRYAIDVWEQDHWRQAFCTTEGHGALEVVRVNDGVSGQYVRVLGWESNSRAGYDIQGIEIYHSLHSTLPIVPPDEGGKPADTVVPLTPLAPAVGEGKDILALYEGTGSQGQEVVPTPGQNSGLASGCDEPDVPIRPGREGLPVAFIDGIFPAEERSVTSGDSVLFEASAADNRGGGADGIAEYEWWSDRQGFLSDQPRFSRSGATLAGGPHDITLRARNTAGDWSAPVHRRVTAQGAHQLYLPLVGRQP
ncbi:MAG: discoidin domain-containing protein [Anaerolineae bacterium]